jgi:hypothetical protein
MAVIKVAGYMASCAKCGWWSTMFDTRGVAVQHELDHHNTFHEGDCQCPVVRGHTTHLTGCKHSQPTPTAATAE